MISVYVFGIIIVVLFVAGLIVAPWLEEEPAAPDAVDVQLPPEERREAALDALQELEFEYETGKLSDDDYHRLRNKHARAAVEARDEGEGERRPEAARSAAEPASAGGEDEPGSTEPTGDGGSAASAEDASDAGEPGGAHCPECGTEAEEGARYCAQCGSRLPA